MKGITTIEDLELLYYDDELSKNIAKADDPVLTTTTGVYNPVYGAQVWSNLNNEANAFGVLPKYPWQKSGWRIITGRANATGTGGVAENATLPDTAKPTWVQVDTTPKTVAHTFENSETHEYLTGTQDDATASMDDLRRYFAEEHKFHINAQLLADVDTVAGDNMESIDRVCSSQAEESALLDSGDSDIYGLDRSSSTDFDAYVDFNASSGTSSPRALTINMLRDARRNIQEQSGYQPNVILTGYDTGSAIEDLFSANVTVQGALRIGDLNVQVGVNGIQTDEGVEAGVRVSTVFGIPMIMSQHVVKDVDSRIYFLNTTDPGNQGRPFLGISIAKPTQYFEAGISGGDPFAVDKFGDTGMFRTMGELICTNFKAQGKIRDLDQTA